MIGSTLGSTKPERPILFSGPMIRALLAGTKSQTRRVIKPVRGFEHHNICKPDMAADPWAVWWHGDVTDRVGCLQICPYGVPGDRLWVRETWTGTWLGNSHMHLCYAADGSERRLIGPSDYVLPKAAADVKNWVTPLFMPRWASRLTLEITGVRVQRVQEISEEDAIAEGAEACNGFVDGKCLEEFSGGFRCGFYRLWDSINAKRGYEWNLNPWVWAISFRRLA